uniref:Chromo domain-containing protein n=1 Tax=Peronospora matthiolae TaxID=2874970 RepID=A0AAV1V5A3_9STRA
MVAAGLGDVPAATGDDEDPRPKRRRLRRVCRKNTDSEGEEDECPPAEYTVTRIMGRRGQGPSQEYLVQWEDRSSEWMAPAELKNWSELMEAYDRYVKKHPDRRTSYAEFVARDLPSIQVMADSPKDDCALHAIQMAFELMGGFDRVVMELGRLSEKFLQRMVISDSGRRGELKYTQLVLYLWEEVPRTEWCVCKYAFKKNWYTGVGTGPLGVAQLAWRAKNPLEDGAYLIYALKASRRGNCIEMQKIGDAKVVREDGATHGIMT